MPSCLGLYVENNIIKYAKISKERDNIRIEAFGMKFYDNIDETIKDTDAVMIMTEWPSIKEYDLNNYEKYMNNPIVLDGRNCYKLEEVSKTKVKYLSIGRKKINF